MSKIKKPTRTFPKMSIQQVKETEPGLVVYACPHCFSTDHYYVYFPFITCQDAAGGGGAVLKKKSAEYDCTNCGKVFRVLVMVLIDKVGV